MFRRDLTEREEELLREEHSLELQLEGIFRDLYVSATQRGIMQNYKLRQVTMDKAQQVMHLIRDIEIELREIAHKASEEQPEEPEITVIIAK